MTIVDRIKSWFEPYRPLPPGIYHYQTPPDAAHQYRLHLRVEKDGHGVLLINAARVLHLNQTATEHARLLIENRTQEEAAREIARRYDVALQPAEADYATLQEAIVSIAEGGEEVCPVSFLEVERIEPMSAQLSAPYRMDLALTYRCQNDCPHCYVGRPKDFPEMPTEDWKRVIDACWEQGIPHLTFTGGEATLRPDLVELVQYAENVGLVTGLQTNGRRLRDRAYLDQMLLAGLDHVQITLESHDPAIHDNMVGAAGAWQETVDGIRAVVNADVYMMTNTTITTENVDGIEETIAFAASLGVPTFGCNSLIYSGAGVCVGSGIPEDQLAPILERVKDATTAHQMRLIWYTPTQYCEFDPTGLELGIKGCTAARYNMAVEPNGDVLPCQSYYVSLGNILTTPWEAIWEHELARYLRNRDFKMAKCYNCPDQVLCGGGCPLYNQHEGEESLGKTV
ncbi:MAG TPA: radical SAM protein [Anaerolineae bacterium]|nr:radical SAM protein [Anaerolineae bacterium]